MSGTSVDGLDLACCSFTFKNGRWNYHIAEARTISYPEDWRKRLLNIVDLPAEGIWIADREFGEYIGVCINEFIRDTGLRPSLIASHGHTVFHQPEKKLTLQIGNGLAINAVTGLTTVTDFRRLDVILGGQGAPLVPVGDRYLFPDYSACLNLGGFSNLSYETSGNRIACDICPVNIVLNRLAAQLNFPFDRGGELARKGKLIPGLLDQLNELNFYKRYGPKSLGLEWVNENVTPLLMAHNNVYDLLNTFTRHIAFQISEIIDKIINAEDKQANVLVTGGGAYNDYLIQLIREKSNVKVIYEIPGNLLVDYKESLIFAFLGELRIRKEINALKSVTGASRDSIGGVIYDNCTRPDCVENHFSKE